jgi:penicillin-binding protein 1A
MGVQSELKPVYALALGALEVNLLEMTSAYTTFANKGIHNPVHGITRVTNRKGEILYENKPKPEKAIEPDTTAIMTWMMRGVVNEGTARSAQIGRPVAGKTGTTDKERDLWFIGFIPQLVTGVWLGNDNNQPTGNASSTAAYAWSRFMTTAVKNIPAQDFLPRPENVDKRKPEFKLDPVRPRYQKTLAAPAKDDKNGEESTSQDGSRRSRRSRRAESAENNSGSESTPRRSRRSRRAESAENNSSSESTSRRSESVDNSSSESTPRRSRRRSRRSASNSESTPSSSDE